MNNERNESVEKEEGWEDGFEHSPYSYHANMQMVMLNKKRFCSRREINKLIEKGFIAEPDIQLLKTLYEHGYLSRRAAADVICWDKKIISANKRKDYKNAFRKLVKMGIVHRHLPTWEEDGVEKSSACIYSLSNGAALYIQSLYQKDASYYTYVRRMAEDCPEVMLNSTVVGQFHSNILKYHQEQIKKDYINYSFSVKKRKYLIPLLYKLKRNDITLDVAVIPVRNNERHGEQAICDLAAIYTLSKRNGSILKSPIYIMVCENSTHARNFATMLKKTGYENIPVLYCMDRSLISSDILENMFILEEMKDGYVLQMQKLRI